MLQIYNAFEIFGSLHLIKNPFISFVWGANANLNFPYESFMLKEDSKR